VEITKAERERKEMLEAGVLKYNTRRRRENRARWYGFHADQAERHRRNLEELIRFHEQKAQQLMTREHEGSA
jgi:hypothetical protein